MALAGSIGRSTMTGRRRKSPNPAAILFGEDQGRYVVTSAAIPTQVSRRSPMKRSCCSADRRTGGDALVSIGDRRGPQSQVPLADLRAAHEGFFPKLMGSELTPEF